ncbi:hypothetical protein GCM10023094_39270 [Rhodococcus olei]|uniref:Anti-sigma-M factor RsmA n=1 Tax=Rhodococcus olei TaxID=2161675 RepID=A0ABP8PDX9_9NOCA
MVARGEDALRPPFTPELLADLHGGVLPPDVADPLRAAVADDRDAQNTLAALDRVRGELGALRTNPPTPAPIPADVLARVHAALDAEGAPAPAAAPVTDLSTRRRDPVRIAAGAAAALVVIALAAIGVVSLTSTGSDPGPDGSAGAVLADPVSTDDSPGSAATDPATVQLGDELRPSTALSLLGRNALGTLSDPDALSECLRANGIDPQTPLLGSGPVRLRGLAGRLLLLAGPQPPQITALVVGSRCSANEPDTLARADIG